MLQDMRKDKQNMKDNVAKLGGCFHMQKGQKSEKAFQSPVSLNLWRKVHNLEC